MNKIDKIYQPGLAGSVLVIAGILVGLLILVKPAGAVTISQPIVEINADPGETIEQVVQLYDDSMQGVAVYPWVYNFTDDPASEGTIQLIYDPAELKPDREWLKFDGNRINLPLDGSLIDFPYRLELPADAEPGTHLLALTFRTRPPLASELSGSTVYVGGNVVTSIFLRVSGAVVDKIDADFRAGLYTNHDSRLTPAERVKYFKPKKFFFKPPVEFLLTVHNQGNTHQKPDGNVRVTNDLLGGDSEKLLVNPENKIILQETNRTFAVPTFGKGLMFGKYRAKLTLLYGNPLRPLTKEVTFWIIPLVEILMFLLFVLLFIAIWYNWKIRHEYKEKQREKERDRREQEREEREKERDRREQEREERLRQAIEELKKQQPPPRSPGSNSSSKSPTEGPRPKAPPNEPTAA